MARCHHRVQTIHTIPSHNALLCQDDWVSWMEEGEVEAWTARYQSRNSPETKRLFFAATEEMCAFSIFIHSGQPASSACLCFPRSFRLLLLLLFCRKFSNSRLVLSPYSVTTLRCNYRTRLLCFCNISIFGFFLWSKSLSRVGVAIVYIDHRLHSNC